MKKGVARVRVVLGLVAGLALLAGWLAPEVARRIRQPVSPVPFVTSIVALPDCTAEVREEPDSYCASPYVSSIALSADGKLLATAGMVRVAPGPIGSPKFAYGAMLWDVVTGRRVQVLEGETPWPVPPEARSVALSPDGRRLASGRDWVTVWDTETKRILWRSQYHPTSYYEQLAFSPDAATLATGTGDGPIQLWDLRTGARRQQLTGLAGLDRFAFSPDGRKIAGSYGTGWHGRLRVWDVETGRALWSGAVEYTGRPLRRMPLAFAPDGRSVATGGDHLRLWDALTGELKWTREKLPEGPRPAEIVSVTFSPDGSLLASVFAQQDSRAPSGRAGVVELWETRTGRPVRTVGKVDEAHAVVSAFTADRSVVVATFSEEGPTAYDRVTVSGWPISATGGRFAGTLQP